MTDRGAQPTKSVVDESRPIVGSLRALSPNERPQERLERHGAGALSDTELLAMLLRSGTQGMDVLAVARQLIAEAGSLSGLIAWTAEDFAMQRGIGKVKALQMVAVLEVARRVLIQRGDETPVLDTSDLIYEFMQPRAAGLEVEKFWAISLNTKNRLIKLTEVTSGTATSSLAHPREVFREAIRRGATAIVCCHNHPSGDPFPSHADIAITRKLRDSANILSIHFLDHIILGDPVRDPAGIGYYSFRENGLVG